MPGGIETYRDAPARVGIGATALVLALMCSTYFIVYTDRVNIARSAGALEAHLGLTNIQLGVVFPAYGWMKSIGGMRQTMRRGTDRVGWSFTLIAAAYNSVSLSKLLVAAV